MTVPNITRPRSVTRIPSKNRPTGGSDEDPNPSPGTQNQLNPFEETGHRSASTDLPKTPLDRGIRG